MESVTIDMNGSILFLRGANRLTPRSSENTVTRPTRTGPHQPDSRSTPALFLAVEQRPPCRNELEQDIIVSDIRRKHHKAELLRLQE